MSDLLDVTFLPALTSGLTLPERYFQYGLVNKKLHSSGKYLVVNLVILLFL